MRLFNKKNREQLKNNTNQKSKDSNQHNVDNFSNKLVSKIDTEPDNFKQDVLPIVVEELPLDFKIDHSILYEIKDVSVITRLNGLVQGGSQQILQGVQKSSVQNAVKSTGTLLKSDIPVDQLTKAKGVSGGFRATLMGKKGIEKNAVLTPVDSSKISQAGRGAVKVAKVMNITSVVVGQYYMSEVSSKLVDISKNINSIGNYQQREFKSRIMALINNIEEISTFSSEILEHPELRKREIHQLNYFKNDTVQLLEQVNITIQELSNENITRIQEYQSKVNEFDKLLGYQKILTAILEEISKLTYTLYLGEVSIEKCFSSYKNLLNHSNESRKLVPNWHLTNLNKLGIELDNNRFKKQGIEGIVAKPLSLIDKKWDYRELESNLRNKIIHQSEIKEVEIHRPDHLFDEDVELIIKDGKYYYMPRKSAKKS
jgi:hypothetical protein